MAFPPDVAERLLVACHRHCCICHKPAGRNMEIHHIIPKNAGGQDTEENGIPLCFDCHSEVEAYNPDHPKGRRFTPSELTKHKEQWLTICSKPYWHSTLDTRSGITETPDMFEDSVFSDLRPENPIRAQRLVFAIMQKEKRMREAFASRVFRGLDSDDEDTRWNLAMLVEELVLWEPRLVPDEVLEQMSQDPFFAVRSCAAVSYYYLAGLQPAVVPLDVLGKLAAHDEDWYVSTPAMNAMLRLARTRPVVLSIIAQNVDHKDDYVRERTASAIRRLLRRDWDIVPDELLERMARNADPFVRKVAKEGIQKKQTAEPERDYSAF
jgi:hypothetical protein